MSQQHSARDFVLNLILAVLGLFLVVFVSAAIQAQEPASVQTPADGTTVTTTVAARGVLVGQAADRLRSDWRDDDTQQNERAYCVASYTLSYGMVDLDHVEEVIVVTQLMPAKTVHATPNSIDRILCPGPIVHTHPPTDCTFNTMLGQYVCALDRYRETPATCGPSDTDQHTVTEARLPFSIVQCARDVWTFYAPARP